jgi:hypothetical protein
MSSIFRKVRKSAKSALKNKVFVEIFEEVGGIPAGVYELEEMMPDGFVLHVQKKVFLGVLDESFCRYRFIPSTENPESTSLEDFLVKYWSLFEKLKKDKKNQDKFQPPKTFCFMDKDILGYACK